MVLLAFQISEIFVFKLKQCLISQWIGFDKWFEMYMLDFDVSDFKCLHEPLESMEAQGCAGWFSLEKKQEGVPKMFKKGVQFCTQRAQVVACSLERTKLLPGADRAFVWKVCYKKVVRSIGYWSCSSERASGCVRSSGLITARADLCWPWNYFCEGKRLGFGGY